MRDEQGDRGCIEKTAHAKKTFTLCEVCASLRGTPWVPTVPFLDVNIAMER